MTTNLIARRGEIIIGNRVFKIVSPLRDGERPIGSREMLKRAKKSGAELSESMGRILLDNQDAIPSELRGEIYIVFIDWRDPSNKRNFASINWDHHCQRWAQHWCFLGNNFGDGARLLQPS